MTRVSLPARVRTALMLALLLVTFSVGYVAPAAAQECSECQQIEVDPDPGSGEGGISCQRINATCSYNVDPGASQCSAYSCRTVTGYKCCYRETGHCIDDPDRVGSSQICGGLCGCQ
jgi:hypothetical protein